MEQLKVDETDAKLEHKEHYKEREDTRESLERSKRKMDGLTHDLQEYVNQEWQELEGLKHAAARFIRFRHHSQHTAHDLIQTIAKEKRWYKKPVGPLGMHIKMKGRNPSSNRRDI